MKKIPLITKYLTASTLIFSILLPHVALAVDDATYDPITNLDTFSSALSQDPNTNLERIDEALRFVLKSMLESGTVTVEQFNAALQTYSEVVKPTAEALYTATDPSNPNNIQETSNTLEQITGVVSQLDQLFTNDNSGNNSGGLQGQRSFNPTQGNISLLQGIAGQLQQFQTGDTSGLGRINSMLGLANTVRNFTSGTPGSNGLAFTSGSDVAGLLNTLPLPDQVRGPLQNIFSLVGGAGQSFGGGFATGLSAVSTFLPQVTSGVTSILSRLTGNPNASNIPVPLTIMNGISNLTGGLTSATGIAQTVMSQLGPQLSGLPGAGVLGALANGTPFTQASWGSACTSETPPSTPDPSETAGPGGKPLPGEGESLKDYLNKNSGKTPAEVDQFIKDRGFDPNSPANDPTPAIGSLGNSVPFREVSMAGRPGRTTPGVTADQNSGNTSNQNRDQSREPTFGQQVNDFLTGAATVVQIKNLFDSNDTQDSNNSQNNNTGLGGEPSLTNQGRVTGPTIEEQLREAILKVLNQASTSNSQNTLNPGINLSAGLPQKLQGAPIGTTLPGANSLSPGAVGRQLGEDAVNRFLGGDHSLTGLSSTLLGGASSLGSTLLGGRSLSDIGSAIGSKLLGSSAAASILGSGPVASILGGALGGGKGVPTQEQKGELLDATEQMQKDTAIIKANIIAICVSVAKFDRAKFDKDPGGYRAATDAANKTDTQTTNLGEGLFETDWTSGVKKAGSDAVKKLAEAIAADENSCEPFKEQTKELTDKIIEVSQAPNAAFIKGFTCALPPTELAKLTAGSAKGEEQLALFLVASHDTQLERTTRIIEKLRSEKEMAEKIKLAQLTSSGGVNDQTEEVEKKPATPPAGTPPGTPPATAPAKDPDAPDKKIKRPGSVIRDLTVRAIDRPVNQASLNAGTLEESQKIVPPAQQAFTTIAGGKKDNEPGFFDYLGTGLKLWCTFKPDSDLCGGGGGNNAPPQRPPVVVPPPQEPRISMTVATSTIRGMLLSVPAWVTQGMRSCVASSDWPTYGDGTLAVQTQSLAFANSTPMKKSGAISIYQPNIFSFTALTGIYQDTDLVVEGDQPAEASSDIIMGIRRDVALAPPRKLEFFAAQNKFKTKLQKLFPARGTTNKTKLVQEMRYTPVTTGFTGVRGGEFIKLSINDAELVINNLGPTARTPAGLATIVTNIISALPESHPFKRVVTELHLEFRVVGDVLIVSGNKDIDGELLASATYELSCTPEQQGADLKRSVLIPFAPDSIE